jgi:hypothetical protein
MAHKYREDVLDALALLNDEIESTGRLDLSAKLDTALGFLGGFGVSLSDTKFSEIRSFFWDLHSKRLSTAANKEVFLATLRRELELQVACVSDFLETVASGEEPDKLLDNLAKLQALSVVLGEK